jgi:hypothetical protein
MLKGGGLMLKGGGLMLKGGGVLELCDSVTNVSHRGHPAV